VVQDYQRIEEASILPLLLALNFLKLGLEIDIQPPGAALLTLPDLPKMLIVVD